MSLRPAVNKVGTLGARVHLRMDQPYTIQYLKKQFEKFSFEYSGWFKEYGCYRDDFLSVKEGKKYDMAMEALRKRVPRDEFMKMTFRTQRCLDLIRNKYEELPKEDHLTFEDFNENKDWFQPYFEEVCDEREAYAKWTQRL